MTLNEGPNNSVHGIFGLGREVIFLLIDLGKASGRHSLVSCPVHAAAIKCEWPEATLGEDLLERGQGVVYAPWGAAWRLPGAQWRTELCEIPWRVEVWSVICRLAGSCGGASVGYPTNI